MSRRSLTTACGSVSEILTLGPITLYHVQNMTTTFTVFVADLESFCLNTALSHLLYVMSDCARAGEVKQTGFTLGHGGMSTCAYALVPGCSLTAERTLAFIHHYIKTTDSSSEQH